MISKRDKIRFWSKIQKHKNCCWIWTGYKDGKGYGGFWHKKKWRAHRLAYYLYYKIDPNNLCVLHKCDNPQCVRPDHLFLGTNNDNNEDCLKKGRRCDRFTKNQIQTIRRLYCEGYLQRQIAIKYGITISMVSYIVKKKSYKSVI